MFNLFRLTVSKLDGIVASEHELGFVIITNGGSGTTHKSVSIGGLLLFNLYQIDDVVVRATLRVMLCVSLLCSESSIKYEFRYTLLCSLIAASLPLILTLVV